MLVSSVFVLPLLLSPLCGVEIANVCVTAHAVAKSIRTRAIVFRAERRHKVPKSKQQKRDEAIARQQEYDKMRLHNRIVACHTRHGLSRREVKRLLLKQIEAGGAA